MCKGRGRKCNVEVTVENGSSLGYVYGVGKLTWLSMQMIHSLSRSSEPEPEPVPEIDCSANKAPTALA